MNWPLLIALGVLGTVTTAMCVAYLFVLGRLRRRHRVDPKISTGAPMRWLADPRTPAQLHRRLARVGTAATAVADEHRVAKPRLRRRVEQPPMVELAEDLRREAVRLDQQVVQVRYLAKPARRQPLQQLSQAVAEIEVASVRLVHLSAQARTPTGLASDDADITNVAAQVERLAAAHQALTEIDERAGLRATS